MKRPQYGSRWGQSEIGQIRALQSHTCRVCAKDIFAGDYCLHESWSVQYAHIMCGWCRDEEKQVRAEWDRDGAHVWKWGCPVCNMPVCSGQVPPKKTDGTYARLYCAKCVERAKRGEIPGKKVK